MTYNHHIITVLFKCISLGILILLPGFTGCLEKQNPEPSEPSTEPLYLYLEATPTTGYQPLEVTFKITIQNNPEKTPKYTLDFGDGTTTTTTTTHTYNAGIYTATATVIDAQEIYLIKTVNITVNNKPPTNSIQTNNSQGEAPLTISFTGIGNDIDGKIISWTWEFDDGTIQTTQNTSHIFLQPGTYTISLTVTDNNNATSTAEHSVIVEPIKLNWQVTLIGETTHILTRKQFEPYVFAYGQNWSDGENTWNGVPLWRIIALVDDAENETEYSFNDTRAEKGYTIKITAGDGFSVSFRSKKIARNNGYLLTNTVNGEPLPEKTPRDRPSWPLHLRGDNVHQPYNIGNITTIELIGLNNNRRSIIELIMDVIETILDRFRNT